MQLIEAIGKRRAVRDFESLPVNRVVFARLIEAAIQAPRTMNLQPWTFAALLDSGRIDSFAQRALNWMLGSPPDAGLSESVRKILGQRAFSMFSHAPALLLVMPSSSTSQAAEDCCLAAQSLLLAANDDGVGSCRSGLVRAWRNLPSIKNELGLPEHCRVVAPIALGYPRVWPQPMDGTRLRFTGPDRTVEIARCSSEK